MPKATLLSLFLYSISCFTYATAMGNISGEANSKYKQVTATGHFSKVYESKDEARMKAPDAAIDEACGQDFIANVYDHIFHCKNVHGGFQCKQTMKANCEPR